MERREKALFKFLIQWHCYEWLGEEEECSQLDRLCDETTWSREAEGLFTL